MSGPAQRMIFILGFLAACVAFWLGWRRLRRLGTAHTRWEALQLAFYLSLALMVGCSSGTQGTSGTTTTTTTTTATATATVTGLGEDADRVWGELAGLWEEAATYEEGVATSEQLDGARSRVDGLLARLGGIDRVTTDAPGLVALLRIEFMARLEMRPADVLCYEPLPPQTDEAEAYQRLAARVDAVEELASKGYMNSWLRENVLARLRNDLQSIRMGMREGDEWRTEDWRMREVDPAEIERVLERVESALSRLGGT
jgi:hypothetical protein